MAPINLFDISITEFLRANESLKAVLSAAKDHAASDDVANTYPALRLCEDMLPLTFQVQMVTNTSKRAVERLAPQKGPFATWESDEKTLDDLIARVDKTLDLLKTVSAEDLAGVDENVIECGMGPKETAKLEAKGYVLGYAVPNVFFHLTTAYAILRKEGVPLGKRTLLNAFMEPVVIELIKNE